MITIDTSTEFGARVARRLRDEQVAWLTTVSPNGAPQPSPIWFLWDGTSFLIFSQPNTLKLRNIAANPRVAINLNSTTTGGDVIILTGQARIDDAGPSADELAAYDPKYTQGMASFGATPEAFHQDYSVLIRVTLEKLRGH